MVWWSDAKKIIISIIIFFCHFLKKAFLKLQHIFSMFLTSSLFLPLLRKIKHTNLIFLCEQTFGHFNHCNYIYLYVDCRSVKLDKAKCLFVWIVGSWMDGCNRFLIHDSCKEIGFGILVISCFSERRSFFAIGPRDWSAPTPNVGQTSNVCFFGPFLLEYHKL